MGHSNTNIRICMNNESAAEKAAAAIKNYVESIGSSSDFCLEHFIEDFSAKGNEIKVEDSFCMFYDGFLTVLPEICKAIATALPKEKYSGTARFSSSYGEDAYANFSFSNHTLTYHSEYFDEGDCYCCADEDCCEIAHYKDFSDPQAMFVCPQCGRTYTATELEGKIPDIENYTWTIA